MDHHFRRGIYRPNAQRLSISLAPLVAQRSLLFRVKADLAQKTSYGELSPTEESPRLFLLSASTASARIISAALSAMSAASVYSQDSWKGESSPFGPILVPQRNVDTRRHAIAFSPSVQWQDLSDEDSDRDSGVQTPLQSASSADASIVLPKEDARSSTELAPIPYFEAEIPSPKPSAEVQLPLKLEDLEGGPAGKVNRKKRVEDTNNKRLSKHSKAFGKVISHLSLQPSKKVTAKGAGRRQTAITVVPEYKLPELKAGLSPIRMSFIAKSPPVIPPQPAVSRPAPQSFHYVKTSDVRKIPNDAQPNEKARQLRMTMPPTPSRRSTTPPPTTPAPMPMRKGHRRYKSSPAAAQFAFNGWNAENMPPLPPMPPLPTQAPMPVRPRARSITTRAISAPFPVQPR
jgi:hypothetical protein